MALAWALAIASPGLAQESACDAIYAMGTAWEELAIELDEALDAGLGEEAAESFESRIAEEVPIARNLAEVLRQDGDGEAAELAAQLHEDLDYLESSPDFESLLDDIDYLIETLDLIVEVCDERRGYDEPPVDAAQEV